jgi:soluble lytic murein transglycosylase-like protein
MGKVCLSIALTIVCVFSAFAQNNRKFSQNVERINAVSLHDKTETTAESEQTSDVRDNTEDLEFQKTKWSMMTNSPSATLARLSAGKSLDSFSTGNPTIDGYILESSLRYNVDPLLIFAQMSQESSFQGKATSPKGARGLMQLMPATAIRWGVKNIYNPKQNIEAGVKYMRWLLDTFGGDVKLALAAYNAGEGAVKKYGNKIPPYSETKNYVARISAHYDKIKK